VLEPGGSATVFGSIESAREFARDTVAKHPRCKAEIFDSSPGLFETIYGEGQEQKCDPRRIAARDLKIGVPMLAGAVATATYAALGNWQSIWAYIIGTKLLIVGSFIVSRGLGWFLDQRREGWRG
jgi:hypothetical protein